jgi:hypothetical protein
MKLWNTHDWDIKNKICDAPSLNQGGRIPHEKTDLNTLNWKEE